MRSNNPGTPATCTMSAHTPQNEPAEFPRLAFTALVMGAFIIGFSGIMVRLSPVGPSATGFYRVGIALPVFFLAMAIEPHERRVRRPRVYSPWMLALPGFFFGIDMAVWHWAVQFTTVSNATLFANLAPIIVTLIAWRFFGERMNAVFLLGLALGLAGVTMLMGISFRLSSARLLGDGLGVFTAFWYAGYQLSMNRLRRQYSTITLMAWNCAVAMVVLWLAAVCSGESFTWGPAQFGRGLAALLTLALVCHSCGQGLIVYGLQKLPAAFSSVSLLVQPMVATAAAWVWLGEALSPWQVAGAGVVLCGIYLARWGSLPNTQRKETEPHGGKTD
ncbi:MAG: DMT family transporter [Candidatus Hydrogenedentota bacterium]